MAEYPINKGIGRPVEFKGLKAQYLFIFCGGLLALFVLFVILYMVGIGQWICIGFGAAIVLHPRMADLRTECPVRRTWADEVGSGTEPSPIPYQPAADNPIIHTETKGRNKMRNTSKITTLENRFPLLAVEHGCIISKDADITVAFEVELPELYTVTSAEYEAIHGCWCKAIKVLPDFSVVHKQDWFIKERYKPELEKDDMSFLSRSFERHFNERPYLKHTPATST